MHLDIKNHVVKLSYSLPIAGIRVGVQSHEGLLVHDGGESRLAGHVWVSSLLPEDHSSLPCRFEFYTSINHIETVRELRHYLCFEYSRVANTTDL